jgi:hypothetical protein
MESPSTTLRDNNAKKRHQRHNIACWKELMVVMDDDNVCVVGTCRNTRSEQEEELLDSATNEPSVM